MCALAVATVLSVACGSNGVTPSTQSTTSAVNAPLTEVNTPEPIETGQVSSPSQVEATSSEPDLDTEPSDTSTELAAAQPSTESATSLGCESSPEDFQAVFLPLINDARALPRQCGTTSHEAAAAVAWSQALEQAARKHSEDMATQNFFSHTGSDNSSIADRVDATGYPWQRVGENIAAGQITADEVLQGWLNSPGHCRNIMNPDFEDIAVTCDMNSSTEYATYWTNVFGAEFP